MRNKYIHMNTHINKSIYIIKFNYQYNNIYLNSIYIYIYIYIYEKNV